MNTLKKDISFIIPAFNEEDFIYEVIKSIRNGDMPFSYEIIVVDHNSTDTTASIAKSLSAKVVTKKGGAIASVRNSGVTKSLGEVLVFLDSDVTLTKEWFQHIGEVINELQKNPYMVSGSHCSPPDNSNWIEHYWFHTYIEEKNVTNLGTGHMIVTRKLFDRVGGFNESLSTGEDYDFCMRVRKQGGEIVNNPHLRAIHHGYPKNIWNFIQREAWHGIGDVSSLKSIYHSKVAVAALLFLMLHLAGITFLLFKLPTFITTLPFLGIIGLLVLSSYYKYGHCSIRVIIINSIIFYFYYFGRMLSFFTLLSRNRN